MANTNVKVFIASSAELNEQRRECIIILNQINKSYPHLHLEAVEWEYDIPHGSYADSAGVQKAINPLLEPCKFCILPLIKISWGRASRDCYSLQQPRFSLR